MTKEQARLIKSGSDARDDATIKSSDRIIVITANKSGDWALAGNLPSNKVALKMLQELCTELENALCTTKT